MATPIKKTGQSYGQSNALGHGGRAAQLKARGVPDAVIGMLARKAGAAPGGPNYHGDAPDPGKRKKSWQDHLAEGMKARGKKG